VRDRLILPILVACVSVFCGSSVPSHVEAQVTPPGSRDVDLTRRVGPACAPPDCYSSLVDEQVKLVQGTARLAYPDSLRYTGLSGRVTVHFIVDVTGQVRQRSVQFVESTHQSFSLEALRALAGARFTPAKLHGQPVSQAMKWTFEFRPPTGSGAASAPTEMPQPLIQPPTPQGVLFEFQVTKSVTVLPGGPAPRYPDVLRSQNVQGEVLAQFVVDTMGHADSTTINILRSGHEMFSDAVRAVIPKLQFTSAEVAGRKVKQLVQMPFQFNLSPASKPPKPPRR
jgi:TonB family protein